MRKLKITGIIAVFLACTIIVDAAESLPKSYKSSNISCSLVNRYYGAGFASIKFNGQKYGSLAPVFLTLKDATGQKKLYREKTLSEASHVNITNNGAVVSFETMRPVTEKGGVEECAVVKRQNKISNDTIKFKATLTASKDIQLAGCWLLRDIYQVPTATLKGAMVECMTIGRDPKTISALVPKVYSKDKWNMKGSFSQVKFITKDSELLVSADEGSGINLIHYGGSNIGLYIKPMIKYLDLAYKKGAEISWGASIRFKTLK